MYTPIENEIFHIHTYRCTHASNESEHLYVKKAIELGASRIVFTDHGPYMSDQFTERMRYSELEDYLDTIWELKDQYADKIEIICGLELEYIPGFDDYYRQLKAMPKMELLILGQHFCQLDDGTYSFEAKDKSFEFISLFKAMEQGIDSGYFDVIAHPDRMLRRRTSFGDKEREASISFINKVIQAKDRLYIERNIASMEREHQYWREFWDLVPADIKVLDGLDAHSVADVERRWRLQRQPL